MKCETRVLGICIYLPFFIRGRREGDGWWVYRSEEELCGASGKQSTCQCRRCKRRGFDPWIRKIPWSRKWQPTPVFWPGEFHRQRSLVGYILWGHKELGTTEEVNTHTHTHMNRHISLQNNRSSIMRGVSPNPRNFCQVPEKLLKVCATVSH